MYWDVHCHMTDLRWGNDLSEVLAEAHRRGISGFGLGGIEPREWERQIQLMERFPQYRWAPVFGLHPLWVHEQSHTEVELGLDQLAKRLPQARALGEMGLDAREKFRSSWDLQMEAFRSQLELAAMVKKPVVLHMVHAHAEAHPILWLFRDSIYGGFVHAFSGGITEARRYVDLNLAVSVGGVVTRSKAASTKGPALADGEGSIPRSQALRETLRWLPDEFLLLETDSPDQKVKNWPSTLHHPSALWNIAEAVAEIRNSTPQKILALSSSNFERILGLSPQNSGDMTLINH